MGPQDPKGVSRDMARDLTSVAGELATLRGPQETPETVEGAKEGSAPVCYGRGSGGRRAPVLVAAVVRGIAPITTLLRRPLRKRWSAWGLGLASR